MSDMPHTELQQYLNMQFNAIDYGIIAIMSLSILMGILRGFVREAMSLVTWIAALTAGLLYCETVATWFTSISVLGVRLMLAFVLIVLAILIVGGVVSHLIGQLIRSTKFSITDRIMGTLFGFARGAAIVAVIVLITSSTFIAQESIWKASSLIPSFNPLSSWIKEKLPEDLINKLFAPTQKLANPEKPTVIPTIVNEPAAIEPSAMATEPATMAKEVMTER